MFQDRDVLVQLTSHQSLRVTFFMPPFPLSSSGLLLSAWNALFLPIHEQQRMLRPACGRSGYGQQRCVTWQEQPCSFYFTIVSEGKINAHGINAVCLRPRWKGWIKKINKWCCLGNALPASFKRSFRAAVSGLGHVLGHHRDTMVGDTGGQGHVPMLGLGSVQGLPFTSLKNRRKLLKTYWECFSRPLQHLYY